MWIEEFYYELIIRRNVSLFSTNKQVHYNYAMHEKMLEVLKQYDDDSKFENK